MTSKEEKMREIGDRFIAYKIRGLTVKPVQKNPNAEEVYHCVNKFLTENRMKLSRSLLEFGDYGFSNIVSKEAFQFIQTYDYFAFVVDDYLEKYPQECAKYAKYFMEGQCPTNDRIERLLQYYFSESKRLIKDEEFLRQHNEMAVEWFNYFPQKKFFNIDEHQFKDEAFIQMRIIDGHVPTQIFIFTLDVGLRVTDQIKQNEDYIRLNDELGKNGVLVNDIFSFIKELKNGQGEFNYVYVKMMNNGLTVEQAMDQIVVEINETIRLTNFYANKLIASNNECLANYAKKVINIMDGNAYFSATCRRYGNPEYKFFEF